MKHEKIGPGLLFACQEYRRRGPAAVARRAQSLGVVSADLSPKPTRAVVFLHCDPKASFKHLEKYEIYVNQPAGRVRTGIVPLESVEAVAEEQGVKRILGARYLRPRLDVASVAVNLPGFRNTSHLTGKGVIVGIIDSGIDPHHPAFKGRILRIWDQTLSGPGVKEGAFGVELKGKQLTASRDKHGHGTHVAGIAAGADKGFGGVAPGAKLVIVKTTFLDAHIADAVRYIFRVAKDLGQPAVINLSLGGHSDAHDGTDSLSQVIDEESGAGRVVCCAAGNEGDDNIHVQVSVPKSSKRTLSVNVPSKAVGVVEFNGWYAGAKTLEVAVANPKGVVTPFQPIVSGSSPTMSYSLPGASVAITTGAPDASNGDHNIWVEIKAAKDGGTVPAGSWKLIVRNVSSSAVTFDAWVLDDAEEAQEVFFQGKAVSDAVKIGSPGSAASAVTVASYTTRIDWNTASGDTFGVSFDIDDITSFSSEGPLRNKAQKPDVAAPGAMIISAFAADSAPDKSDVIDKQHVVMAGTSMASPFVAGLVALLLERKRTLDPDAVKKLLRARSRIPGKSAGTFDPKWGFGLINTKGL